MWRISMKTQEITFALHINHTFLVKKANFI